MRKFAAEKVNRCGLLRPDIKPEGLEAYTRILAFVSSSNALTSAAGGGGVDDNDDDI